MEYNLQKTLSNETDYESHYPIDFNTECFEDLTPGIGQIVPYDNFIVPLHNNSDLTTIFKEPIVEQLGGGQEIEDKDETSGIDAEINSENNEIQDKTNDKSVEKVQNIEGVKRKNMDSAIFDSFMHPKMFKTKFVSLDKNVVNTSSKNTVKKTMNKQNLQRKKNHKNINLKFTNMEKNNGGSVKRTK